MALADRLLFDSKCCSQTRLNSAVVLCLDSMHRPAPRIESPRRHCAATTSHSRACFMNHWKKVSAIALTLLVGRPIVVGVSTAQESARRYENRLTLLDSPPPLLADYPEFI